ncbi:MULTISPECIES: response regulator [Nocardioides]|uniref:Response regulator n=1 Tax=Nocardioides kribbensis TaxID=305517 RepID=A0ABV1NV18_9ACTN|nr:MULTISPECIES: response regulator [Nocardioides]KQP64778.1 hypothetical protein ASF47_12855 [Nocardioides sp. Leaf285]KQQ43792.1 hypothetical protein ASF50_07900 [Nocardioides sp. Leaf307]MBJ7530651.1 response regulator transcription factor [Nocardioides sp.]MCM3515407.1 response regulator [Nocardioides sp. P86]
MAKVLVVEDESDVRELLSTVLEMNGHEVESVPESWNAMVEVSAGSFDLVVMDVSMPGMNGLELARLLKAQPSAGSPQILMVSARSSRDDIAAGLAAGADAYVTKPFSIGDLSRRVEDMLAAV